MKDPSHSAQKEISLKFQLVGTGANTRAVGVAKS